MGIHVLVNTIKGLFVFHHSLTGMKKHRITFSVVLKSLTFNVVTSFENPFIHILPQIKVIL